MTYERKELFAIYELGRMYFEMGYFVPAERIFNGLSMVDGGETPSELALALLKLERGLPRDAAVHLRSSLSTENYNFQTKIGLAAAYVASGELARAKTTLLQLRPEIEGNDEVNPELKKLWEAYMIRCESV